jgi:tyrosine aminotransferase
MIPDKNEVLVDYSRVKNGKLTTPMFATPFIANTVADDEQEPEDHPAYKRSRSEVVIENWDVIQPSLHSQNTVNPIRRIVDVMSVDPNPAKELIKLNIGDPTVSGILPTHPKVTQAVADALMSGKYNGYGPAIGFPEVREALAEYISLPEAPVTADDIVLTSGCSHALQLAIEALADPGQNILVPRPGFPLYATLMNPLGVFERYYNLLADKGWEADLVQMEKLIDNNTAAIVVNNPNNPCGAVYSREHLEKICRLAEKYRLPIIADEIYGDMIYGGARFYPMATLRPKVPILTCDGISKRFLVPGWRLGWLVINDVDGVLSKIRNAVRQLAQKIVGPCALMQGALPAILKNTPQEFFDHTKEVLSANANVVYNSLKSAKGLSPIKSSGAMYIMIGLDTRCFPKFKCELELIQTLLKEESVYCLPGTF